MNLIHERIAALEARIASIEENFVIHVEAPNGGSLCRAQLAPHPRCAKCDERYKSLMEKVNVILEGRPL